MKTNKILTYEKKISVLRKKIDAADKVLIKTLATRGHIVDQIGRLKKMSQTPIRQKSRWRQLMKSRLDLAKKLNVDKKLITHLFELIQRDSIRRQSSIKLKSQKKGNKK